MVSKPTVQAPTVQAAPTLQPVRQSIVRPVVKRVITPSAPDYSWERLVRQVKELANWREEDLKNYLDAIGQDFNPESFREIIITLQMSLSRYQDKAKERVLPWDIYYDVCPICGGPTLPDPRRDRKFGALYGWKCVANRYHFLEWRWTESHKEIT